MKILVINTGSSSIKYELFDVDRRAALAGGMAEKIGEERSVLIHRVTLPDGEVSQKQHQGVIADHRVGLNRIADLLIDPEQGIIADKSEISAVGHRVVHGGVVYSLADTGMGGALFSSLDPGQRCATLEIKISYYHFVTSGTLSCTSKVIQKSRRFGFMQSEVFNEDRLVASATGTFTILGGKR